jgi:hypothetical protein
MQADLFIPEPGDEILVSRRMSRMRVKQIAVSPGMFFSAMNSGIES